MGVRFPQTAQINPKTDKDMKTITDVIGREYEVTPNTICVVGTDKILSGWGRAEGKKAKRVVICTNWSQADRVESNMKKNGFIYVNSRRGIPTFSASRYVVSYDHADNCPLWNK